MVVEITSKILGGVLKWDYYDCRDFIINSCMETASKIYTLYTKNPLPWLQTAELSEKNMAAFNLIFLYPNPSIKTYLRLGVTTGVFCSALLNWHPIIKNPKTCFKLSSFINHLFLALSYPARITSSVLIGKAAQHRWNGQDKGPISAIVTTAFLALSAWNLRHTVIHELRTPRDQRVPTLYEIFNFPLKIAASHAAAVGLQYLWNRQLSGPIRTAALGSSIVYFSFFNIFREKGLQEDSANKVPAVSIGGKNLIKRIVKK